MCVICVWVTSYRNHCIFLAMVGTVLGIEWEWNWALFNWNGAGMEWRVILLVFSDFGFPDATGKQAPETAHFHSSQSTMVTPEGHPDWSPDRHRSYTLCVSELRKGTVAACLWVLILEWISFHGWRSVFDAALSTARWLSETPFHVPVPVNQNSSRGAAVAVD